MWVVSRTANYDRPDAEALGDGDALSSYLPLFALIGMRSIHRSNLISISCGLLVIGGAVGTFLFLQTAERKPKGNYELLAVQEVLEAKRKSGERNWRHHHYLRGSVYCGQCGGRLIYTQAKGRGGIYEYFVCRGRQQRLCTQPHQRVIAVERAVEDHYRHVELASWRRDAVRGYVRAYVGKLDETAAPERSRIAELVRGLDGQERKLLAAHYADRISESLFNEEQDRLRRERASAERLQAQLAVDHRDVLARLHVALELTASLQAAYILAGPIVRRLFNQAIFKRIWLSEESVDRVEVAEPFDELITIS